MQRPNGWTRTLFPFAPKTLHLLLMLVFSLALSSSVAMAKSGKDSSAPPKITAMIFYKNWDTHKDGAKPFVYGSAESDPAWRDFEAGINGLGFDLKPFDPFDEAQVTIYVSYSSYGVSLNLLPMDMSRIGDMPAGSFQNTYWGYKSGQKAAKLQKRSTKELKSYIKAARKLSKSISALNLKSVNWQEVNDQVIDDFEAKVASTAPKASNLKEYYERLRQSYYLGTSFADRLTAKKSKNLYYPGYTSLSAARDRIAYLEKHMPESHRTWVAFNVFLKNRSASETFSRELKDHINRGFDTVHDGETLINRAILAQVGDELLQYIVDRSPESVNTECSHGYLPLQQAAMANNIDAVNLLLKAGADPLGTGSNPLFPFLVARNNQNHDLAELLKPSPAAVMESPMASDILVNAAFYGDDEYVAQLLDAGMDINATSQKGNSILMSAVIGSMTFGVEAAPPSVDEGNGIADPSATTWLGIVYDRKLTRTSGGSGYKVLQVAPESPAAKAGIAVSDLISGINGQRLSSADTISETVAASAPGTMLVVQLHKARANYLGISAAVKLEQKPAHFRVQKIASQQDGNTKFNNFWNDLRQGNSKGAFERLREADDASPYSVPHERYLSIMKSAIAANINPNLTNQNGETAIMLALSSKRMPVIDLVLSANPDLGGITLLGSENLNLGFAPEHEELLIKLVRAGAPVDARMPDGRTPLIAAYNEGMEDLMSELIMKGADLDGTDRSGMSLLYYATIAGDGEIVEGLIDAGANIHLTDENRNTALFYAYPHPMMDFDSSRKRVVNALEKAGVNPDHENIYGYTAAQSYRTNMEFWRQEQQLQQMEELTLRQEMAAKQQRMAADQLARENAARRQQLAQERQMRAQQQQKQSGFNFEKFLTLGAGLTAATIIGDAQINTEAASRLASGLIADSMPGVEGVSNTMAAARTSAASQAANPGYAQSAAPKPADGTGLPRSNFLFTSGYGTCSVSNNKQLASLCQGADAYYNNYRQVFLTQGAAAAEQLWQAHVMAAKNALRWRSEASSPTGIDTSGASSSRSSSSALKSRSQNSGTSSGGGTRCTGSPCVTPEG